MHLGERLREVRFQVGLGVHELARRINVSTWQIQLVESGRTRDPSLGYAWRCADAYGMSLEALLDGVTCPPQRPHGRRKPHGLCDCT